MADAITAVFTPLINMDTLLRTTAQLLHDLHSSVCRYPFRSPGFGHFGIAFLSAVQVFSAFVPLCSSSVNQRDYHFLPPWRDGVIDGLKRSRSSGTAADLLHPSLPPPGKKPLEVIWRHLRLQASGLGYRDRHGLNCQK